eukprot:SAG22_NODE_12752_length_430_cov_1.247734_1_plen_71_part_10
MLCKWTLLATPRTVPRSPRQVDGEAQVRVPRELEFPKIPESVKFEEEEKGGTFNTWSIDEWWENYLPYAPT